MHNNMIMLLAPKDNAFYNFRKECIIALRDAGYEIVLVSPYGKKIDFFTRRGCDFIDINIDRRGTNPFSDFKLILDYYKLIKKKKPGIVLTYTTKCSVYGGIACRIYKTPYIVNNSGLMGIPSEKKWLKYVLNLLYKIGYSSATCMMYQNTEERDVLNKAIHNKARNLVLPGSGVNLEEFEYVDYPEKNDEIIFNYVARIMKAKGIEEFLQCAKKIKGIYSNTRFIIYGDYDDDDYRSIISDYISKGIVEYGGIQLDMRPHIKKAHAVIHPSYYEGMTNVCLEHSAMGRVCIASDIAGCREIIDEGITGYTFPVKDVDTLIEKVEQFITLSYSKKVEMGKSAREKMEREFNRDIVTKAYLDEIRGVLGD
jgi:glycosyltransferase involved in cell wall biosynthesis